MLGIFLFFKKCPAKGTTALTKRQVNHLYNQKTFFACLLLVILAVPSLNSKTSAEPQKGPALDEIIIEKRQSGDVGLEDVATGKLDLYLRPLSPSLYLDIPEEWKENLTLIKCTSGFNALIFNPVHDEDNPYVVTVNGKQYFNLFAIRKVRFAINFILSRRYLVDEVYLAGKEMYGLPLPSNPMSESVEDVYAKYGFTPDGNEDLALQMIADAMERAASELGGRLEKIEDASAPAGFWWYFDGEPVSVIFLIRIEDERYELGHYVADKLEKSGI